VVKDVQNKRKKEGALIGCSDLLCVLPMPALSCRYLYQNEGYPLSCVCQIVGPEGCYKSTYAAEKVRWHRMCGGMGTIIEAESKPAVDMRMAVVNWDENTFHVEQAATVEDWQSLTTRFYNGVKHEMSLKDGPGATIPYGLVVDSLTGKKSRKTRADIEKLGHAKTRFATEAKLISDYMGVMPDWLVGWPFSFIGVNHLKANIDKMTGMVDRTIPGGWELKFQQAFEVEMGRIGGILEFKNFKQAKIAMMLYKNTYGPERQRIHVNLKTWQQQDDPNDPELKRLHARFEWWESSILLLAKGEGMTQKRSGLLLPQLKEACDIHEKSGGTRGKLWWSKRLDVPSSEAMSAHDLGVLLERRPDVLADLYPILGIARRPFFRPGVDFLAQVEEFAHVAAQADAADDMVQRATQLRKRASGLGATPGVVPQLGSDGDDEEDGT